MSYRISDYSISDATHAAVMFDKYVKVSPSWIAIRKEPTEKFLPAAMSYLTEQGYKIVEDFYGIGSYERVTPAFMSKVGVHRGIRVIYYLNPTTNLMIALMLCNDLTIYFTPEAIENGVLENISALMLKHCRRYTAPPQTPTFSLVVGDGTGNIFTKSVPLQWQPFEDPEIKANYGEEFYKKQLQLDQMFLDENKRGLYLLHGVPGSGKSSYIKHIISKYHEARRIIYFPPECVNSIGSPDFIPFLLNNRGAVLLLEDAENVLQHAPDERRSSATTNLLNLCDGLLADVLNVTVIATFNCNHSAIDPALLRPGRLKFKWNFEKLTEEQSNAFLQFHNVPLEVAGDYTLAELYEMKHIHEDLAKDTEVKQEVTV